MNVAGKDNETQHGFFSFCFHVEDLNSSWTSFLPAVHKTLVGISVAFDLYLAKGAEERL